MTRASREADFLVIGSGLAGLTYALNVAQVGAVALLTKKTSSDANSSWAQGGIAGVLSDDDSFELHKNDTLIAGAGLCREEAVEILVREGPERIRDLIALGAQFDTALDATGAETLSLGREGGHSRNRIVHTADYTGWECERALLEAVHSHPNIQVYEHYFVTDLIRLEVGGAAVCGGAYALDTQTGEVMRFRAKATMLATGGCGQVYAHSTNPRIATGDGVAMAWRAGVPVGNMEFIQFHPTTLYHPTERGFLITEALRGEGGVLRHADGEAFMARYDDRRELAPRDIVARAIVSEMKRRNVPCVYLDASHLPAERLKAHFPTIYERCLKVGIDITQEPIPIVPAQHYQCGGAVTDLDGATALPRLYAAGEVACTGVHGANRLASNSLLEAMVFAYRAAQHTLAQANTRLPSEAGEISHAPEPPVLKRPDPEQGRNPDFLLEALVELGLPEDLNRAGRLREVVQQTLQRYAGIVRASAELETAQAVLQGCAEIQIVDAHEGDPAYWEARNIALVGALIVESALQRRESRGLHYTLDYPQLVESERHDTILTPEATQLP